MTNPFLDAAFFITAYMVSWFIIAFIKKDNSVVDATWGLGFVGVAWVMQWLYLDGWVLPIIMVSLWGLRLSGYLFIRWIRSEREDWRYTKMRESWKGNIVLQSFLKVFVLQGVLMWIIALPIIQTTQPEGVPNFLRIPGLILFTTGWLWQSIADWQLFQFKSNRKNKGKILTTGLWKFSRHPNYFGEILVWWGIFLVATPFGNWWISLLSPLLITFLLTRVSGVTMLEAKMKKHPEYAEYMKGTNALIPNFCNVLSFF